MRTLSDLGIGLSLVFGCLFLALVAEVYYLLWWKKRVAHRHVEDDYASSPREFLDLFSCWMKPSCLRSTALNPQQLCSSVSTIDHFNRLHQLNSSSSKELLVKPSQGGGGEDGEEIELMRLHNLCGPPRILFTIEEETKEDLESQDGRSNRSRRCSRGRSLSDVPIPVAETPFLTPLSSPPFFTPPLTPLDCYSPHGLFNPLFESSSSSSSSSKEVERSRMIINSSPPPKFKFLKDAEEKLYRKTLMEEALRAQRNFGDENVTKKVPLSPALPPTGSEEVDESFIRIDIGKNRERGQHQNIIIGKNRERGQHQNQYSSSNQVIPLPSSPSTIRSAHGNPFSCSGSRD